MTREQITRELDFVDFAMQNRFDDYEEATHRALQEAIKLIKQEPSEDCISRKSMIEYQQYLHGKMSNEENHKLWEFINNLPSVTPIQRWIPVSESLPKERFYDDDDWVDPSDTVLVQLNNGEMRTSCYCGSNPRFKDKPWMDLPYPTTLEEVIAWMPLPEAYKGESEGHND